jgi:uncharacterized protein YkwD
MIFFKTVSTIKSFVQASLLPILLVLGCLFFFSFNEYDSNIYLNGDNVIEDVETISTSKAEKQVLELINAYRAQKGFTKLTQSSVASEQARLHSKRMALKQVSIGHDGFSVRSKSLKKNLKNVTSISENIAFGNITPKEIVEGWIRSTNHKNNILSKANLTGIGVFKAKNGSLYYTQIFLNQYK